MFKKINQINEIQLQGACHTSNYAFKRSMQSLNSIYAVKISNGRPRGPNVPAERSPVCGDLRTFGCYCEVRQTVHDELRVFLSTSKASANTCKMACQIYYYTSLSTHHLAAFLRVKQTPSPTPPDAAMKLARQTTLTIHSREMAAHVILTSWPECSYF